MGTRLVAPGGAALHGGYYPKSGYDAALRYVKSWTTSRLPPARLPLTRLQRRPESMSRRSTSESRAGRSSEAGWWKGRPGLTATPYAAIAIAVVALGITTLVAKSKTLRAAESVAG